MVGLLLQYDDNFTYSLSLNCNIMLLSMAVVGFIAILWTTSPAGTVILLTSQKVSLINTM